MNKNQSKKRMEKIADWQDWKYRLISVDVDVDFNQGLV